MVDGFGVKWIELRKMCMEDKLCMWNKDDFGLCFWNVLLMWDCVFCFDFGWKDKKNM